MGNAHSPSSHRLREQRAQQAAVMRGYANALTAAFAPEPLPANMRRLLDQFDEAERRKQ